jgi:hypothetical protein
VTIGTVTAIQGAEITLLVNFFYHCKIIITMHPPLATHKHQGCEHIIQALDECHSSGLLNKYSGKCNDIKLKLNECLGEEVGADAHHLVS